MAGTENQSGSQSEFKVVDGLLHVSNGPGFLETNDTSGDFVLKVEARVNGDGLNGGVFFRPKRLGNNWSIVNPGRSRDEF